MQRSSASRPPPPPPNSPPEAEVKPTAASIEWYEKWGKFSEEVLYYLQVAPGDTELINMTDHQDNDGRSSGSTVSGSGHKKSGARSQHENCPGLRCKYKANRQQPRSLCPLGEIGG